MAKLIIKNRFGTTPNNVLNNNKLTFKAKGLYGFLQSKPSKWRFSTERIAFQSKEGEKSVRSGLQELEQTGYLKRVPAKDKKGAWDGYDYKLYQRPQSPSACFRPTEKRPTQNGITLSKKDFSKKEVVVVQKDKTTTISEGLTKEQLNFLVKKHRKRAKAIQRVFTTYLQKARKHTLKGFDSWLLLEKSFKEEDEARPEDYMNSDELGSYLLKQAMGNFN